MNTIHQTTIDEHKWRAVLERAPQKQFCYAVVTTGVVCRTACPSRPPRRDNVRFFDSVGQAMAAGYRPCKRCLGREDNVAVVTSLCHELEDGARIDELAHRHDMSTRHLQRLFKSALGVSPKQYQIDRRVERFLSGVRNGQRVVDAAYEAGFPSMSRLHEQLKRRTGLSPTQHRELTMCTPIFFAIEDTALGTLLLAQTVKGLCFAGFYDERGPAKAALAREFPEAETVEVDARQLEPIASAFDAALSGDFDGLERLPLDVRGTAFQQAVWDAARTVPPGTRISYSEIARRLDHPKAARAVAGALASNRIAMAIPCHRVVPANGSSAGGYRWGSPRKADLLAREAT
ncbi:MAG: methylated-DNA--[protein]-cysteine S-methyltransferase [Gammaproteobacteria bacterium]|jgi:AraC family transcriptional regulator of adaptative response/methylated-DNA-[protein]-cysteine methyltransferase